MEKGMEKIFKEFNIKLAEHVLREIDEGLADSDPKSSSIMTFSDFVDKMVNEGNYGHSNIVFLEKMVEQIEALGDYFFDISIVKGRKVVFIDIETLDAYIDWLQKLIWHLDGLQIIVKSNDIVHEIANIQTRISYSMANIALYIGSIDRLFRYGFLEQAMSNYFSAIGQISIFGRGTLEESKGILQRVKDIIG